MYCVFFAIDKHKLYLFINDHNSILLVRSTVHNLAFVHARRPTIVPLPFDKHTPH